MRRGGRTSAGVYPGLYREDQSPNFAEPPQPQQTNPYYVEQSAGPPQQPQSWGGYVADYNPNAMSWAPVTFDDPSSHAAPQTGNEQNPVAFVPQGGEPARNSRFGNAVPTPAPNQSAPFVPFTAASEPYRGSIFTPKFNEKPADTAYDDPENEPPLLEELGINFEHIRQKTMAVVNPFRKVMDDDVLNDSDLSGPLVFCLAFGAALLLAGKVHFGYVYGIGLLGCVGMFALLNLMNVTGIPFLLTVSILGYSLLPIVSLAMFAVFVSLNGWFGIVMAIASVFWSSLTAAKLFVGALHMEHALPLVAYPCLLVYAVFALLAVF